ncbi:MAG TPA: DUF4173 domain-containing protein [Thermoanaerobaculia bacterium]|nr:DUF4173 domain-containing protein [Thermoanaerobaculia bacterium]
MERHRIALLLAASALLLGIAGDLLLRWIPWGVNVPLWIALLVAATYAGAGFSRSARLKPGAAFFPAVCTLVAAAGLAWRDSPVLRGLDVLLLLVLVPMLALEARGVRLAAAGVSEIGFALATTGVQTVAGFPQLVFADVEWSRMPRGGTLRTGGVVARGVIIATPALLLFGSLLVSADAAFAKLLTDVFAFDVREALNHIVVTIALAAMCAGFLRSVTFSGEMIRVPRPGFLTLAAAETNIALGLVNVLFAAFVAVQFRYFFGDAVNVTHSEYARRGFFELVWVVALVLPMLLCAEWLIDKERPAALRTFRLLALTQIALVLVIAASAYHRMQLYRDEFGLTQLRLYTTAFMIALAVLLLWFAVTVLTGNRARFAIGVVATAMITIVALHAINPDALIVETNLSRAEAGRRAFDTVYASKLSDDAAPVILANRDAFAKDPAALKRFTDRKRTIGWRTWNLSRARAIELLRALSTAEPSRHTAAASGARPTSRDAIRSERA